MNNNSRPLLISIRKPGLRSVLLYLWFFNLISMTAARFALSSFGLNSGTLREVILWLVASVPLIACLLQTRRIGSRRMIPFFGLYGLVLLAFCLTALIRSDVAPYLLREGYGPDRILRPDAPLFAALFFLLPDDSEELKKDVTTYAYVYFVYQILLNLLPALQRGYWINTGAMGQEIHSSYSLTFGYAMCFPTVVFLYQSIKNKKLIHILMTLAGLVCIITNGNRGAILIPLLFIALMLVSSILENGNTSQKALKITVILVGCLFLFLFGEFLLGLLLGLLSRLGISSRSIDMLLDGHFSEDNGRDLIWFASIKAIQNGGFLGNGLYGDRPFVAPIHYVGYSHNLFLELLASFGILGVGIIIRIVLDSVRMVFMCKDRGWRELYIIFFSISCQLLLSLSFWYVWTFWAAVAIAYNYRHFQRNALTGS